MSGCHEKNPSWTWQCAAVDEVLSKKNRFEFRFYSREIPLVFVIYPGENKLISGNIQARAISAQKIHVLHLFLLRHVLASQLLPFSSFH